jgi:DNA-directed RNA polymerase specialized sigma24 family protein
MQGSHQAPAGADDDVLRVVASRRLSAYARHVTTDPAEIRELISEAWSRAWVGDHTAAAPSVDTVLSQLRGVCREFVRRRRYETHDISDVHLTVSTEHDTDDPSESAYADARTWLWELPQRQRDAAWFHLLLGFSLEETAVALDVKLSTGKTHLYRGLATLRRRAELSHAQRGDASMRDLAAVPGD